MLLPVTRPARSLTVNGRPYLFPTRPVAVICLDGSSPQYIDEAIRSGCAPFLTSLVTNGQSMTVHAAMPTFTNPNNMSIVTGVPPAQHGICGNYFLDRASGEAVMMNEPGFLRCQTIPSAFSRAGARVAVITAKHKLTALLGFNVNGLCASAEQQGIPVYSGELSISALRSGVELVETGPPDILYLSTSDYIQHSFPPGSRPANEFYAAVDSQLAALDRAGVTLVITADHGMSAKTDDRGHPRIVFLQTMLDDWYGTRRATAILPITDPYTRHHGSLGSFAAIHLRADVDAVDVISRLKSVRGVDAAWGREAACALFELPYDRTGDVVVCADSRTVFGTRPADHDLSVLETPLRSHGGLAERAVPMLFNRPLAAVGASNPRHNYDAFWIALNGLGTR
jgi:phosphonoacetate hydrolase